MQACILSGEAEAVTSESRSLRHEALHIGRFTGEAAAPGRSHMAEVQISGMLPRQPNSNP